MTSQVSIQNALNAGELSPSLYGRTDLEKWHSGSSTCRNFFVNYRGGVMSRPGFAYVGTCLQNYPDPPPRDIPFQFNINQGYALEFGTQYMRVKTQGAYVSIIDDPDVVQHNITNITQADPAVLTVAFAFGAHGYVPGDWLYIYGVQGMTEFDGLTWIVDTVPSPTTLTLTDLFGTVVDSTAFNVYISGGKTEKIFTLTTPYEAEDLPYLKYAQSADVMTLTCVNPVTGTEYPPYSLTRLANDNWTLVQDTFGAQITPPTSVTVQAYSSTTPSTWYAYVITSVDAETGEESVASHIANVQNNDISVYQGSNALSWDAVEGADSYNIYAAPPSYSIIVPASSVFGYIGTSLGPSYTDTNTTPDFTIVPPAQFDPFAKSSIISVNPITSGANYSQGTVGFNITTSTGSGFDGIPVVANGGIVGFVITNQGSGYAPGDTITFTDTGGGIATGSYHATANPSNGDTLTMNDGTVTFEHSHNIKHPSFEVVISSTLEYTLQALANFWNASQSIDAINATYTYDVDHFYITYKTPGSSGNNFTLGAAPPGWVASGSTLTGGGVAGTGASATLTIGPSTGTYPAVPAYFQQRRVYASSQNQPDTYWMSQPGLFSNMDTSIPVTDSDSITGTPWSQQVNGIQFLVPMPGGLVVLTGKSAWQVSGGAAGTAITPSNQTASAQAYNGCNDTVQPLTINYDILYIQAKGSIARDLSYNFFTNIYTGTDLTVLSNHLFTFNTIVQWCWCEEPFKLVWAVRDDGVLLCLTYIKEQEVYSWSRHDTNGMFLGVCSITEPPVDALYVITQRFIGNQWRYYSERLNNRMWNDVEQSYCVDAGVSYPVPNQVPGLAYVLTYPTAGFSDAEPFPTQTGVLQVSAATGTGVTFHCLGADEPPFTPDSVGAVIRAGGGKATITTFVDDFTVLCDITNAITEITPDDPHNLPLPVPADAWTISVPTTIVTNLNHLEGLQVAILADGGVVDNQTVVNGQIELDQPASIITIGLPYTCQVQTLYMDHPDGNKTVQNRRKLISSIGLRVEASRGLQLGSDQIDSSTLQNYASVPWTNMTEIKERANNVNAGTAMPLYTGDYFTNISSNWTVKGQLAVQQIYPLPANILSMVAYWTVGDGA